LARHRTCRLSSRVVVRQPRPNVRYVLELTWLADVFEIEDGPT
jgi:anti-anti-sigma regulatory factor